MAASSSVASKPVPRTLFMLVGFPGSGKSTFAIALAKSDLFIRLNQDEQAFQTRSQFNELFESLVIRERKHIVLDRCNHTVEQREYFINFARKAGMGVIIVHFNFCPGQCLENIKKRIASGTSHPSIKNLTTADSILQMFINEFDLPSESEGVQKVFTISSFKEADALRAGFIKVASGSI